MQDLSLPALHAFASVAKHGGFRRAAGELGMSPSALSHAVSTIEKRLGTRLINRTTRSVAVTDAGRRLLERLGPALDELDAALDEATDEHGEPAGTLRLNASPFAVCTVLGPRLPAFMTRFPAVRVEVTVDDDGRDVVGRGFDATVRVGRWMEGDMIALPIGPAPRRALVAAPSYLQAHPAPRHPDDLATHVCLRYDNNPRGGPLRWSFKGDTPGMEPHGPLTSSDVDLMVAAALGGAGILYMAEPIVRAHIESGRLLPLLEDWWPTLASPVSVFYPSRRQTPGPLRAFLDFLRQRPDTASAAAPGNS